MTSDIPPLTPLHCVLEFLHTGDVGALRRPLRYGQNYAPEIRARLFQRLGQSGARVRGNIDGAQASWIEPLALLSDFQVGYWWPTGLGQLACLESRVAYPADLVRDYNRPVKHPAAVTPNYRLMVLNAKVETAPLLLQAARIWWRAKIESDRAVPCLPSPGRFWWPWQIARRRGSVRLVAQVDSTGVIIVKPSAKEGRQTQRARRAMRVEYPNGVSDIIATETVRQTCNAWLEKNEEKSSDGKIPLLPGVDVYARLLNRRK